MRQWARGNGNTSLVAAMAAAVSFVLMAPRLLAQDGSGSGIEFVPSDEVGPPEPMDAGGAAAQAPKAPETESVAPKEAPPPPPAPAVQTAEPTPVPPPSTSEPASPTVMPKREHSKLTRRTGTKADILFGSYRVRIMYGRPTFRDQLKHYETLYGKAKDYPQIGIDWFAWDWYATMGLGVRFGYYSDDGNAALVSSNQASDLGGLKASDLSRDQNGPTSLLLIPLQILFTAEITPFPKKWLVLDGWAGWERLYFQETRNQKQSATRTTGTTTTTTTGTSTSTTSTTGTSTRLAGGSGLVGPVLPQLADVTVSTDKTLTNVGWRNAIVIGGAANILLNGFDEQSALSLRNIGIGGIYLSPFMEWIKTVGQPAGSTFSFGRSVVGLAFTFETVK